MAYARRNNDRRRRVLYTTQQADSTPSTAASRRAAEQLREARRPTAAYGARVKRRLRGRWFSLVPVRRRTLITITSALVGIALLLCAAHYASVAWPSIAYQPEIARPLRLDRPDSFGRWMICALLACSSGVSLLVYQLRRYTIDDYQGRYRLWRLVLIVLMLASVNSLVSIIDWSGALLDAGFGKRVALTGSDWIRLVVSIGGAILALRMIAEVRRSRWALVTMIAAATLLAIPEAAKWNFIKVETVGTWAFVTSAPLLAFTMLFISLGGYLRMLYREARQIEEGDSLAERMQRMRVRVFQRSGEAAESDEPQDSEEEGEDEPRRRFWRRKRSRQSPANASDDEYEDEQEYDEEEEDDDQQADDEDQSDDGNADQRSRPKRRWLGLRRAKPGADDELSSDADEEPNNDQEIEEESPAPKQKKRRRFSMRLSPPDESEPQDDVKDTAAAEESEPEPTRKRGLGGWLRSKKSDAAEEQADQSQPAEQDAEPPAESDNDINPDDIDWDSMSKSERRRLRKKLRRQGNAA